MQEAQANLKQAAVEFLDAAQQVAARAAASPADPIDAVSADVLRLGDLQPAIGEDELADLRQRLAESRLAPQTIVQLVGLARQVAAALQAV